MIRVFVSALLLATLSAVRAQTPAPPAFEAASIKLNTSGRPGGGLNLAPARLRFTNATLKLCIQVAWNVKEFQVSGGPGWMDSKRYDIDAVAPAPFQEGEYRIMLQALLADRFGVVLHRDTQEKSAYALVVSRGGSKLPPPIDDPSIMFSRTESGDNTLQAKNITMHQFADALTSTLGAVVVDRTEVEGRHDVSFQWTPDPAAHLLLTKSGAPAPPPPSDANAGPSIFTALQEKFGLKLEARKLPVEMIVVDRANPPSDN